MAALVFYSLLTVALLTVAHWAIRQFCTGMKMPSTYSVGAPGSIDWFPRPTIRGAAVAVATAAHFFIYFAVQSIWPHPLAGIELSVYRHEPAISYYLSERFAGSSAVRSILFGYLIGVAAYFWFWDRRAADLRVKKVIAKLQETGKPPLKSGKIAAVLWGAVNRMDPPSLAVVMLVLFAVATIEAPSLFRLTEWKFGKDGVTVSMREGSSPRDVERTGGVASGASGSPNEAETEFPAFTFLTTRISRDVETICAIESWRRLRKGKTLQPSDADAFVKTLPSRETCGNLVPPLSTAVAAVEPQPPEFGAMFDDFKKYADASQGRTLSILRCFAALHPHHERRQELRSLMAPIVESYLRVDSALRENGGHSLANIAEVAEPEMRAFLNALAALADPSKPSGLASAVARDSSRASPGCKEARAFASELASELRARNAPVCSAVPNDPSRHVDAVCELVALDGRLPYGRMALAAMTYVSGEPAVAALQVQKWVADFSARRSAETAEESVADAWLKFIAVYFRNFMLRTQTVVLDRSNLERLLAQPEYSAADILDRFVPDFERLARDDSKADICGKPQTFRLTLLLTVKFDTHHFVFDRQLKFADKWEFGRRLRDGALQTDYAKAIARRAFEKCIEISEALPKNRPKYALVGLQETEADYWIAVADYLETQEGSALSVDLPDSSPATLRVKAAGALEEALRYIVAVRRDCGGERKPTEASTLCGYTYQRDPNSYKEAEWLLTSRDLLGEYEASMRSKLATLKRMEKSRR